VLQSLVQPWAGYAVRHLPDTPGRAADPYDFSYCGRAAENRWNVAGEPTLYLAQEKDVALAEFARHLRVDRAAGLAAQTYRRKVYRFELRLGAVLDLRSHLVWQALSLQDAPRCFAEKSVARATAQFIRQTTAAQAILVPSIAFLDDLEKWCLVVFLEKLPQEVRGVLLGVAEDGYFEVS
jgi:RES domain-containing protein